MPSKLAQCNLLRINILSHLLLLVHFFLYEGSYPSRITAQVIGILDILTFALSSPPTDNDAGRLWLRVYSYPDSILLMSSF